MMVTEVKRAGPIRTAGVLAAVVLLAFAACETPAPTAMPSSSDPEAAQAQENGLVMLRAAEVETNGEVVVTGKPGVITGFLVAEGEAPLLYLDGVRIAYTGFPTALDMLSPADIESIEVIKAEAAEALYGSEASGGVIQIVTKAQAEADDSR